MAIAFAIVIVIASFFSYEFTYDHHLADRERIYLVNAKDQDETRISHVSLGRSISEDISEIESSTVLSFTDIGFKKEDGDVFNTRVAMVSATFFQVFKFESLSGFLPVNLQPSETFVTASTAIKHFGTIDVIGKELMTKDDVGYEDRYIIRGVLKDLPKNSSLQFDMVYLGYNKLQSGILAYNWIRFKKGVPQSAAEEKLSQIQKRIGRSTDVRISFTSLPSLHFSDNEQMQQVFGARPLKLSITLGSIALLILIITSINYINLSLARSSEYIKEISIRKTLGASRGSLLLQFTMDSVLLFVFTLPIAYFIAWNIFPFFKDNLAIALEPDGLLQLPVFYAVILLALLISLPCGIYPVLSLLKTSNTRLMSGGFRPSPNKNMYRNILVTLQYSLSIILIIFSIVIYKQVHLLKDRPLGFDKEQLLILPYASLRERSQSFKDELQNVTGVISATGANVDIGKLQNVYKVDSMANQYIVGDFDFLETMGLTLLAGTSFDKRDSHHRKYNADYMLIEPGKENEFVEKRKTRPLLVTQDLLHQLNISVEEAVGRELDLFGKGNIEGTIIGVVAPFEFGPQRGENNSKIILGDYTMYYGGYMYVKIENHRIPATIAGIENVWKKFLDHRPFSYSFADERVDRLYHSEQGLIAVVLILTLVSCSLSILGAASLLALTIAQRTREIGIRKVLGAPVYRIVYLVMKDSVSAVAFSLLLAIPASLWICRKWLEDYAYKIHLSWWIFVLACVVCLAATIFALGYQSIKAALANPVDSLRDE